MISVKELIQFYKIIVSGYKNLIIVTNESTEVSHRLFLPVVRDSFGVFHFHISVD